MPLFGPPNIEKLKAKGDVSGLIDALRHKDWLIRREAVRALGEIGDPQATEPLTAAFNDQRAEVRGLAAAVLVDLKALEPLIAALKNKRWQVRASAAEALGHVGDPRAVEHLITALKDSALRVRAAAAGALAQLKDPGAARSLAEALTDKDEGVWRAAADALGKLGNAAVQPISALIENGSEWATTPQWIKVRVTKVLGEFHVHDSEATLRRLLNEEDPFVRDVAAEALLSGAGLEPLTTAMKEDHWRVRAAAAKALGNVDDPRGRGALVAGLKDDRWEVQAAAVEALGILKDPRAVQPLVATLEDTRTVSLVRQRAAAALGKLRDRQAIEPLVTALTDSDSDEYCVECREFHIGRGGPECFTETRFPVREAAAQALQEIGGPEAERALAEYRARQK